MTATPTSAATSVVLKPASFLGFFFGHPFWGASFGGSIFHQRGEKKKITNRSEKPKKKKRKKEKKRRKEKKRKKEKK
jgi:hypothetical protein